MAAGTAAYARLRAGRNCAGTAAKTPQQATIQMPGNAGTALQTQNARTAMASAATLNAYAQPMGMAEAEEAGEAVQAAQADGAIQAAIVAQKALLIIAMGTVMIHRGPTRQAAIRLGQTAIIKNNLWISG